MGFYILWPHSAAFSKQSTIIQSDKRANTVHSRVRKSPPHHHHTHTHPLSNPFILHPYVALFFLSLFHTSLVCSCCFTTSFLHSQGGGGTFNTHALVTKHVSDFCFHELISLVKKCVCGNIFI